VTTSEDSRLVIRPATVADLPTLVAMRDRLNDLERAGCPHASIQRMTVGDFAAVWGRTLEDPHYCWRVVEVGGRPVGFGLVYLTHPQLPPSGAFLHWAYLEPDQRGRGLGRLLFEEMLLWCRERGAGRIELQYIDGNDAAEHFWRALGFRPYARKCVMHLEPSGY
jgi:GNAT superfamily N-acetyltransferase